MTRAFASIVASCLIVFGANAEAEEFTPTVKIGEIGSGAPITAKPEVEMSEMDQHMDAALHAAIIAYDRVGIGRRPVITSGHEFYDWRKSWSLHLQGKAFDFRANYMTPEQLYAVAAEMQAILGEDFDVVPELYTGKRWYLTHIHCEYQPKQPVPKVQDAAFTK